MGSGFKAEAGPLSWKHSLSYLTSGLMITTWYTALALWATSHHLSTAPAPARHPVWPPGITGRSWAGTGRAAEILTLSGQWGSPGGWP